MKVLNLQCAHAHGFEGWFASEDDFQQQLDRGLLTCPVCGDATVRKMLSAPRLNLGHAREPREVAPVAGAARAVADDGTRPVAHAAPDSAVQAQILRAMRELMARSEDVGERFADEARAMHHGDAEQRSIRGRTTPQEALELVEEGIEVLPLPHLPGLKETLQ